MRLALSSWALVAAAALALTACSGSGSSRPEADSTPVPSSSTTAASPPPRPAPPPPMNACYRLGYAEAIAPTLTKRPVPCSGIHTAVTFYVGSYDKALPVDGARVRQQQATVCGRRFAAYVGGTLEERRLSLLRTVWFTPSATEAGRGAHWFQCTAIALRGEQNLALLRGPLHGVLAQSEGRDHYGLCGTTEPGTAGFEQRICAAAHTWRALRTVPFAPGPYPGEAHVQAAGRQPCQDAGHDASSDPLHYRWSYQWPSRTQWRSGQTYGVCWAPG